MGDKWSSYCPNLRYVSQCEFCSVLLWNYSGGLKKNDFNMVILPTVQSNNKKHKRIIISTKSLINKISWKLNFNFIKIICSTKKTQ